MKNFFRGVAVYMILTNILTYILTTNDLALMSIICGLIILLLMSYGGAKK